MLVVRRRAGETILIGDDVEIEILGSTGSHVKLGIRAPKHITILRKEIHLTQQQNAASASEVSPEAIHRLLNHLR